MHSVLGAMDAPIYIPRAEVARLAGCTPRHVLRLVARGKLPVRVEGMGYHRASVLVALHGLAGVPSPSPLADASVSPTPVPPAPPMAKVDWTAD